MRETTDKVFETKKNICEFGRKKFVKWEEIRLMGRNSFDGEKEFCKRTR